MCTRNVLFTQTQHSIRFPSVKNSHGSIFPLSSVVRVCANDERQTTSLVSAACKYIRILQSSFSLGLCASCTGLPPVTPMLRRVSISKHGRSIKRSFCIFQFGLVQLAEAGGREAEERASNLLWRRHVCSRTSLPDAQLLHAVRAVGQCSRF